MARQSRLTASLAWDASVLYLSPPVTMLWAWAMFNEPLSRQMLSGMAVSGIGIWMVVRTETRQARQPAAGKAAQP